MRETLHQLTLTLALPIAVGAVWIARAERAEPPVLERATAYRIELADLPLPTRERLRTPGFEAPMPVARRAPEDSAPLRERPMLESAPRPAPVDLAFRAASKRTIVAAPSPRAAHPTLEALPPARSTLRAAPPVALTPPSLSSRGGPAAASLLAPTTSAFSGPGGTVKPPVDEAERIAWKYDRLIERRNLLVPPRDWNPSPIAKASGKIDQLPIQRFAKSDGYVPLMPRGPIDDRADDLSFPREPQPPSILPVPVPLPVFQVAKPEPSFDSALDIPESPPILEWRSLRPTFLVLIPEPGSALLLGAALAALGVLRRSRLRV